jgi:hypothetical protein
MAGAETIMNELSKIKNPENLLNADLLRLGKCNPWHGFGKVYVVTSGFRIF